VEILCLNVLYESPDRIVLQGDVITMMSEYNPQIWKAVDLLETQGFKVCPLT
jgi:hypothetical protein